MTRPSPITPALARTGRRADLCRRHGPFRGAGAGVDRGLCPWRSRKLAVIAMIGLAYLMCAVGFSPSPGWRCRARHGNGPHAPLIFDQIAFILDAGTWALSIILPSSSRCLSECARMTAYPIENHEYDVVVVGAGRRGPARHARHGRTGLAHRLHHKVFPTEAIRSRPKAGLPPALAIWAPTTGNGTCTTPSRGRTAGRRRCDGIPSRERRLQRSMSWNITASLQPHGRGEDLSAPLRRPHDRIRRRPARAAHLRGGRPDRARDPAHALWAVAETEGGILYRIFRHRPSDGEDGTCQGVLGLEAG